MSDLLFGLADFAQTSVGIGNAFGAEKNSYKAMTEDDPVKQELYNNRSLCTSKLTWERFTYNFYYGILPILILILLIFMGTKFSLHTTYPAYRYLYVINVISIAVCWLMIFRQNAYGWAKKQYNINKAKKIDPDTCNIIE